MASLSIIKMLPWGNPYVRLFGACGPSPSQEVGLEAPFFFGCVVADMAHHMTWRKWLAPFCLPSIFHDVPVSRCFLGRPQLLTCVPPLPRVILIIGTRDTVMDRLGGSMERARISITCLGPIRRRRGDRSPQAVMQSMRSRGNPKASLEMSATEEYLKMSLLHQNLGAVKQGANCFLVPGKRALAVTDLQGRHRMRSPPSLGEPSVVLSQLVVSSRR